TVALAVWRRSSSVIQLARRSGSSRLRKARGKSMKVASCSIPSLVAGSSTLSPSWMSAESPSCRTAISLVVPPHVRVSVLNSSARSASVVPGRSRRYRAIGLTSWVVGMGTIYPSFPGKTRIFLFPAFQLPHRTALGGHRLLHHRGRGELPADALEDLGGDAALHDLHVRDQRRPPRLLVRLAVLPALQGGLELERLHQVVHRRAQLALIDQLEPGPHDRAQDRGGVGEGGHALLHRPAHLFGAVLDYPPLRRLGHRHVPPAHVVHDRLVARCPDRRVVIEGLHHLRHGRLVGHPAEWSLLDLGPVLAPARAALLYV